MTALPIYREAPSMSDAELREALGGQLCRCTGYVGIVEAVRAAAAIEDAADDVQPSPRGANTSAER